MQYTGLAGSVSLRAAGQQCAKSELLIGVDHRQRHLDAITVTVGTDIELINIVSGLQPGMPDMKRLRLSRHVGQLDLTRLIAERRILPDADIDIGDHAVMNVAPKHRDPWRIEQYRFDSFAGVQWRRELFDVGERVDMMAHIIAVREADSLPRFYQQRPANPGSGRMRSGGQRTGR